MPTGPKRWTSDEDALLHEAIKQCGEKKWKQVAALVPGRTHTQCLQRWTKVLTPGLIKGPWSAAEDKELLFMIKEQMEKVCDTHHTTLKRKRIDVRDSKQCNALAIIGQNLLQEFEQSNSKFRWGIICKGVVGRTAKQCRERWVNNLDPTIIRGPWTHQEDEAIARIEKLHPGRWALIAKQIPGRTENAVKNRFKALVKEGKLPFVGDDENDLYQIRTKPMKTITPKRRNPRKRRKVVQNDKIYDDESVSDNQSCDWNTNEDEEYKPTTEPEEVLSCGSSDHNDTELLSFFEQDPHLLEEDLATLEKQQTINFPVDNVLAQETIPLDYCSNIFDLSGFLVDDHIPLNGMLMQSV